MYFVVSPARGWFSVVVVVFLFLVVTHNKHLREMHWLGECCLLQFLQVSQRE